MLEDKIFSAHSTARLVFLVVWEPEIKAKNWLPEVGFEPTRAFAQRVLSPSPSTTRPLWRTGGWLENGALNLSNWVGSKRTSKLHFAPFVTIQLYTTDREHYKG